MVIFLFKWSFLGFRGKEVFCENDELDGVFYLILKLGFYIVVFFVGVVNLIIG